MPESASWGGVSAWGVSAPGGCLLLGGVCLLQGGVCSRGVGVCSGGCLLWAGVCSQGGVYSGGVCSRGGRWCSIPACTEADSPPLLTESQTPVETLPWPNFVAAGKNGKVKDREFCQAGKWNHVAVAFSILIVYFNLLH